jgi:spermidine/putrescine transport system substrate-binding protein
MTELEDQIRRDVARHQARAALSRRQFMTRATMLLGGLTVAPAVLAACGGGSGGSAKGGGGSGGGSGSVTISNWTSYMDPKLLSKARSTLGMDIKYEEDINDNNEYFAKIRPSLSRNESIGTDAFVLTDWMANRLINQVKWVQPLVDASFPNKANLRPALASPSFDPTRKYSVPWASGATGIAYNIKTTKKEIRTIDDYLAAPGTKTALSEMRDTVGLFMLATGASVDDPTYASAQPAFDKLEKAASDGVISQFTGNEYVNDLGAGNIAAAIAWSGDVAQITKDNPDVRFVVPEAGGLLWSDNFMIPKTTDKAKQASEFINFFYEPSNAATLMAYIQYFSPVNDIAAALQALGGKDAALVDNPLVVPSDEFLAQLKIFGPLSSSQEVLFDNRFAKITGAG